LPELFFFRVQLTNYDKA